jgi:hypothetical protein
MRHYRRNRAKALFSIDVPTWLVVQTMAGELIRSRPLEPLTDLRKVLDGELERMQADGWIVSEPHSDSSAAFFAQRADERVCVAIVQLEPGKRAPSR